MEHQKDNSMSFLNFAEQIYRSAEPRTLKAYALEAFLAAVRREEISQIDSAAIRLCIASMILSGRKVSTCKRYFGKIHSIYLDWAASGQPDPFAAVLPQFGALQPGSHAEVSANLRRLPAIIDSYELTDGGHTVASVFLYLFFNPAATLGDAATLTFDSAPAFCPQITDIVSSADSSHGRKYVFPLKQGKSRPHEIARQLTSQLQAMLTAAGMRFADGFSRTSITALWVAAAFRCGITVSNIRGCIGSVPQEFPVLSIIGKPALTPAGSQQICRRVANSVSDPTMYWFAMKLRHGVTVADIRSRIAAKLPGRLESMNLFYPTRAIVATRSGRRTVSEVPLLPSVLFFTSRAGRVRSLFSTIGDLAWGFRDGGGPDGAYSVIPTRQMEMFQMCVGRFTPDIELELVNAGHSLIPGRRVRITGGIMAGYEGEVIDILDQPGKRLFSLAIGENTVARWTATVDPLLITPLD